MMIYCPDHTNYIYDMMIRKKDHLTLVNVGWELYNRFFLSPNRTLPCCYLWTNERTDDAKRRTRLTLRSSPEDDRVGVPAAVVNPGGDVRLGVARHLLTLDLQQNVLRMIWLERITISSYRLSMGLMNFTWVNYKYWTFFWTIISSRRANKKPVFLQKIIY